MSEVFILFSYCRTKSCILHFSAKVSLEFPWNLAHFPRNTHPAIWCLINLEYNGISFNLINLPTRVCLIFLHCSSTTILQYCVHLYRDLSIVLHSQLDTYLPGSQVYFLSLCRNKYNWPEEIDIVGDIVAVQWRHNYLVSKFSVIM